MTKIVVNLTMEKEIRDAGNALAQADRRSFSAWISMLIERELKAAEQPAQRPEEKAVAQ